MTGQDSQGPKTHIWGKTPFLYENNKVILFLWYHLFDQEHSISRTWRVFLGCASFLMLLYPELHTWCVKHCVSWWLGGNRFFSLWYHIYYQEHFPISKIWRACGYLLISKSFNQWLLRYKPRFLEWAGRGWGGVGTAVPSCLGSLGLRIHLSYEFPNIPVPSREWRHQPLPDKLPDCRRKQLQNSSTLMITPAQSAARHPRLKYDLKIQRVIHGLGSWSRRY